MYFNNGVEGKIAECLFDTAHKTHSAQEVETLKLQLSTYNVSSKGLFSELPFSFVLEKYIICDICTVKSPVFKTTSLIYVTTTDCTSMWELLVQEHKQKL